jgi:ElaB/YqjD/DUF883 family membrane-anchored ribosome-binding protein
MDASMDRARQNVRRLEPAVTRLRADVRRADRYTRRMAVDRPFLSLALAVTAGYVFGRIISRNA